MKQKLACYAKLIQSSQNTINLPMRDLRLPDVAHVGSRAVHLRERSVHIPLHVLNVRTIIVGINQKSMVHVSTVGVLYELHSLQHMSE